MNKKTEAKCSGHMLTAGFHGANPPLIWRFDLERNHSFTLSLQGDEGEWELGITTPKGEFYSVVHFTTREDAEEALVKVERALSRRRASTSLIGKALKIIAGSALLILVGVALFGFVVDHKRSLSTPLTAGAPSSAVEQGVPQSADDILIPPK